MSPKKSSETKDAVGGRKMWTGQTLASGVKGLVSVLTPVSVSQPCCSLPPPASAAVTAHQHCINVSLLCPWLYLPTRRRERRQEGKGRRGGDKAEMQKYKVKL